MSRDKPLNSSQTLRYEFNPNPRQLMNGSEGRKHSGYEQNKQGLWRKWLWEQMGLEQGLKLALRKSHNFASFSRSGLAHSQRKSIPHGRRRVGKGSFDDSSPDNRWTLKSNGTGWTSVVCIWLNSQQLRQVGRLMKLNGIVGKWENLVINPFSHLKPVKWLQCGSNMREFRSSTNCSSKTVLDRLQAIKLVSWKVEVQGVAIVQLGVDQRCSNCAGCIEIECITNATQIVNMVVTRFWQWRDLIIEA